MKMAATRLVLAAVIVVGSACHGKGSGAAQRAGDPPIHPLEVEFGTLEVQGEHDPDATQALEDVLRGSDSTVAERVRGCAAAWQARTRPVEAPTSIPLTFAVFSREGAGKVTSVLEIGSPSAGGGSTAGLDAPMKRCLADALRELTFATDHDFQIDVSCRLTIRPVAAAAPEHASALPAAALLLLAPA